LWDGIKPADPFVLLSAEVPVIDHLLFRESNIELLHALFDPSIKSLSTSKISGSTNRPGE
jgi:hypothetical protein